MFAAGNERIICCRRYEIGHVLPQTTLQAYSAVLQAGQGDLGELEPVPGVKAVYKRV